MNETPYRRSSEVLWRNVGPEVLLTRPGVETTEVLSETAAEAWRAAGLDPAEREAIGDLRVVAGCWGR